MSTFNDALKMIQQGSQDLARGMSSIGEARKVEQFARTMETSEWIPEEQREAIGDSIRANKLGQFTQVMWSNKAPTDPLKALMHYKSIGDEKGAMKAIEVLEYQAALKERYSKRGSGSSKPKMTSVNYKLSDIMDKVRSNENFEPDLFVRQDAIEKIVPMIRDSADFINKDKANEIAKMMVTNYRDAYKEMKSAKGSMSEEDYAKTYGAKDPYTAAYEMANKRKTSFTQWMDKDEVKQLEYEASKRGIAIKALGNKGSFTDREESEENGKPRRSLGAFGGRSY